MSRETKRDRFYIDAGDAMFMDNTRSFINLETLEINIYPEEDDFSFKDMGDTPKEDINNPDKFFALPLMKASQAFKVMEAFTKAVKDTGLHQRLINALDNKKPFAHFKNIIDNSPLRQTWFEFKNAAYGQIAKEWITENASDALKEKLDTL